MSETKREMELISQSAVHAAETKCAEKLDEKDLAIMKLEEEVFKYVQYIVIDIDVDITACCGN